MKNFKPVLGLLALLLWSNINAFSYMYKDIGGACFEEGAVFVLDKNNINPVNSKENKGDIITCKVDKNSPRAIKLTWFLSLKFKKPVLGSICAPFKSLRRGGNSIFYFCNDKGLWEKDQTIR